MKVSFAKPEGGNMVAESTNTVPSPVAGVTIDCPATVAPAAAPATTTGTAPTGAPAPATQTASQTPALYQAPGVPAERPTYADDEAIDEGDLVIPRFNIVQKVGELSNLFAPGTLLLDGSVVLTDAPKPKEMSQPVRLLVVGLKAKLFVEKVEGGIQGDRFDTEKEVVEAGGTLDYNEAKATAGTPNPKRLFQTLITALCLLEKPATGTFADSLFPYTFGGKQCALVVYSMKGTHYTNAAKHFMSARKIGHLRQTGYRGGWWTLQSFWKVYGANGAFIPVVKPAESTTPEFRAELTTLLGF